MKISVVAIVTEYGKDPVQVVENFELGNQATKFDAWNAFDRIPTYWGKIVQRINAYILD